MVSNCREGNRQKITIMTRQFIVIVEQKWFGLLLVNWGGNITHGAKRGEVPLRIRFLKIETHANKLGPRSRPEWKTNLLLWPVLRRALTITKSIKNLFKVDSNCAKQITKWKSVLLFTSFTLIKRPSGTKRVSIRAPQQLMAEIEREKCEGKCGFRTKGIIKRRVVEV